MVSELSALHIFVFGGDARAGADDVWPASLGARLERDQAAGGFRVAHIYQSDPDRPDRSSPLARPGVDVQEGDVIDQVNGIAALSAPALEALLRGEAGRQVRLHVKPERRGRARRDRRAAHARRRRQPALRRLGVHPADRPSRKRARPHRLRAPARDGVRTTSRSGQREFYPVFNRDGLIIDVRHNSGGNIDSWLLGSCCARRGSTGSRASAARPGTCSTRSAATSSCWCDEDTASDGEAFAEGFRRLGLGKVIGTRTWGGEIWLSPSNVLVDRGIATAAETGVFGPEGDWLIEGHGVDPDIVVDNLPHATFGGGERNWTRR